MLKNQYKKGLEVGLDEAGRGCLAGPVVAAAVILPKKIFFPELKDSKKTSYQERIILREKIEKVALDVKVSVIDSLEIDRINILNASIKAMHNSLSKLSIKPSHIIVDGNRFLKYKQIPHYCIIKGDSKFLNIAAASIIAKTYRDELMDELSKKYIHYLWDKNKGYPTKKHKEMIKKWGLSPQHRKTFKQPI